MKDAIAVFSLIIPLILILWAVFILAVFFYVMVKAFT